MSKNKSPFALRQRIKTALWLGMLLIPLYAFIAWHNTTRRSLRKLSETKTDTIAMRDTLPHWER